MIKSLTKPQAFLTALLVALCEGSFVLPVHATSTYIYKANEYVVIENGLSPDRRFSIAAHAGEDSFHLYLMDALSGKKIGSLEEVDRTFETGADAYHAQWAPDSHHVAVRYRVEHNIHVAVMFRIENRRAYAVTGPSLLAVAAPNFHPEAEAWEWKAGYIEIKWLNSQQFILHDQRLFQSHDQKLFSRRQSDLVADLGRFWQTEKRDDSVGTVALFSADAVCSLMPGDKYKVEEIKPGKWL